MHHPNILQFEGVIPNFFEGVTSKHYEIGIVSQWMEHGNILGFITKYPGANRLELVRKTRWLSNSALTKA